MKQFNFTGQVIAILFALFLVSGANPVSARPDTDPQLGIPNSEPVSVISLAQPLVIGSTGEPVTKLQAYLQELGYFPASVAPTGYYGPVTAQAVERFQQAKGLPITSSVDNALWARVYQAVYPPNTACLADFNGDRVLDTRDMAAYLNAWAAKTQNADVNGDGAVDNSDFTAFFDMWNAGCDEADLTVDVCVTADFNSDGSTDTRDITSYLNMWASGDESADMNGNGSVEQSDFKAFLDLWKQCAL